MFKQPFKFNSQLFCYLPRIVQNEILQEISLSKNSTKLYKPLKLWQSLTDWQPRKTMRGSPVANIFILLSKAKCVDVSRKTGICGAFERDALIHISRLSNHWYVPSEPSCMKHERFLKQLAPLVVFRAYLKNHV